MSLVYALVLAVQLPLLLCVKALAWIMKHAALAQERENARNEP